MTRAARALRTDSWLTGAPNDATGIPDVEWRHADGRSILGDDWRSPDLQSLVAVFYVGATQESTADRVAIAFNAAVDPMAIHLPDVREGCAWYQLVDTMLAELKPKLMEEIVKKMDTEKKGKKKKKE